MHIWLVLALFSVALTTLAVSKDIQRLEFVGKPATMICLFLWLYTSTGLQGSTLWFGIAILCSLLGDMLLMSSLERLFLIGLVAFLIAHLAYITGFSGELRIINAWSLILLAIIAINASRLLRRILASLRARGEHKLVVPIAVYGMVVSFMLYAAMSTLYDPAWKAGAALLVSLGAFLFTTSDAMLAWNRFASPVKSRRVWSMLLYHLGQIGLVAGVIAQFG